MAVEKIHSLTPMQEGMLYSAINDKDSSAYFQQAVFSVEGTLDVLILNKVINKLINRYEILRTAIYYKNMSKPKQVVLTEREIQIDYKDISAINNGEKISYLQKLKKNDINKGFDLTNDPLIRLSVVKTECSRYEVVFSFHHIIMDGWCIGILMNDIRQMYRGMLKGEDLRLQKTEDYSKYLEWLGKQDKNEATSYWKNYLEGYETEIKLPLYNKEKKGEFDNKDKNIKINKTMTNKLMRVARSSSVTLNAVIQTAWGVLLQRYNNTDDVVFGSVVSGRTSEVKGIEGMVGIFINTVPIRVRGDINRQFSELVTDVNENFSDMNKYSYVSLGEVQGLTILKSKLINHLLAFENFPVDKSSGEHSENTVKIVDNEFFEQINYDFGLVITANDQIDLLFKYNGNVYEEETINQIADNFFNILKCIAEKKNIKLSEIDMFSDKERDKLLCKFNDTFRSYPKEKTIQELFEEQVELRPDKVAITFEDKKITYRELNEKSNSLARILRDKGVKADHAVGIMAEKSLESLIGIIAILKAGGAYLPIDSRYPDERIQYMLKDSGCKLLLSEITISDSIVFDGEILDLCNEELFSCKIDNLENINTSDDLAYLIYTSGTTGKPKGVMCEHKNVTRLVKNTNFVQFKDDDKILQTGSMVFDASTFEVWGALLNGLGLCLAKNDVILTPELFEKLVKHEKVTVLWLTSELFNQIADENVKVFETLRYLLVGGDVISPKYINLVRERFTALKVINGYGPTENTTFSTTYQIERDHFSNIPIGKPIANSKTYILDMNYSIMPIGAYGELCVSGDGLGRGYLNREELTNEKFVDNPFELGTKMYKTGDLVRWLPDGNIEFLGRVDNQIKIRGFRIEIGEIENEILKLENVNEAVVVCRTDDNNKKYLCAYITTEVDIEISHIKEELKKELPSYMIPNYIQKLERMPLTINGKVDRNALPDIDKSEFLKEEYEAPRNETEEILAKVWSDVLGVENVGINNNYYELGGDSIKSIQIVSRLNKHNMKLEVKDIMKYPVIKELSSRVQFTVSKIDQGVVEGKVELTPIQKWFFENKFIKENHFNQANIFSKNGPIDEDVLNRAFIEIIKHHDGLRMMYKNNEEISQINRGLEDIENIFTMEVHDLRTDKNYKKTTENISGHIQEQMDIEKGNLIKLALFKTEHQDFLLITIHHMVIDGISWRILMEDLETAYTTIEKGRKVELPLKTTSFKEWAEKLKTYADSKELLREKRYWRQIEESKVEEIKKDLLRDNINYDAYKEVVVNFSKEETENLLRKTNFAYNTEINDILLCALGHAISNWSSNDKVLVGLEGHGREDIMKEVSIDRTIGWFTSMYPVIINIGQEHDLSYSIRSVKESLRSIPNKGIGYGILKYLTSEENKKDIYFKQKPEITFNYLGELSQKDDKNLFKYCDLKRGEDSSPLNTTDEMMSINGMSINGELIFIFRSKRYKDEAVEELANFYKESILKIVEHCKDKKEKESTPWDYGDKDLSLEDLDIIISKYKAIEKIHSLTSMQEGMLYSLVTDEKSHAYFEQNIISLEGELRVEVLNRVFNKLIDRYEILRTSIFYKDIRKPKQVVLKKREIVIDFIDISNGNEDEKSSYLENFKKTDMDRGFDLTNDPLIRLTAIKIEDRKYKVICSFHHIILDGWCVGILLNDITKAYKAIINNEEIKFEKTESYSKYLNWLDDQDKEESLGYWKRYLQGYENEVKIPVSGQHETTGFENRAEEVKIDKALTDKLKKVAKSIGVTLNAVVQTAWGVLLQKYNNSDDVVFGSVVSGRPSEIKGIEGMVGMFINAIPIRVNSSEIKEFSNLAKKVNEDFIEINKYSYSSLAEVQGLTNLKNRLIKHIVVYENYPIDTKSIYSGESSNSVRIVDNENIEHTSYDFGLIVVADEEIDLLLKYNGNVYDREIIKQIGDNFYNILKFISVKQDAKLSEIDMYSTEDRNKILYEFNDTFRSYPKEKTIHELFKEQVEINPNKIALVFEDKKITYKELDERSNSIARILRNKGVKADSIVGIVAERSLETLIAIVGILKSGGAYLPIDSRYPDERIQYMLKDSGCKILLSEISISDEIVFDGEILNLCNDQLFTDDFSELENINTANDLAYVIYTSGTTGKPKGVMCEHRNVTRLIKNTNYIEFKADDRILQTGSMVFDASTFEVWGALLNGIELYLAKNDVILSPELLENAVKENHITILWLTTELFNQIADENVKVYEGLRYILTGGDVAAPKYINLVTTSFPKLKFIHCYGPTENTTYSTTYLVEKEFVSNVPIGKPIANSKAYIVDRNNGLMPIGTYGELCVSGDGLARGYLNREELTNEKFVDNPFEPGTKMYKSGDLARWLPDGNIEFLGRVDNQVKIRGFRIEIGEIENELLKLEEVNEAVVICRTDENSKKYLCAFITTESDSDTSDIKEELKKRLPLYMIPSYIVRLEKLPVTINGKIDRNALPKINKSELIKDEYEAARNEIEETLIKVWSEVLGVENIGINNNYYELGGDSIKSIQIVSRLNKYNMKLEIKDIMKYPVIKDLSSKVKNTVSRIDQGAVQGEVKLTPIQKWFFESKFTAENHFNQANIFSKKGSIDEEILKKAFLEIVKHHDGLRMIYKKDEQIIQINRGIEELQDTFTIDVFDLKDDKDYEKTIDKLSGEIQEKMDLENGILLKLAVFKTEYQDYLLVAIHHLVVDGISWRIILEDLESLYTSIEKGLKAELPLKTTSFEAWSEKLNTYANSRGFLREKRYWKQLEEVNVSEIRKDFVSSGNDKCEYKEVVISFTKEETEDLLRKTAFAYNTEINDILLCALGLSIKNWSSNDNVLVSLEGHGRENILRDVSIDRTIGWFTSMYPLVLDMKHDYDLGYTIKATKENLRHIPNKGIGYGILKYLTHNDNKSDIEFKLKPEISFNYLGEFNESNEEAIFKYSQLRRGNDSSELNIIKEYIGINGMIVDGVLNFSFAYRSLDYKDETIKDLSIIYKDNLSKIVNHCRNKQEKEKTPWDYGDNALSLEDLRIISSQQQDIEKIHLLTPMQEGMLYNLISDETSHAYFEQSIFTLEGILNIEALNEAFNKLIDRYEILRTVIFYKGISKPKQVVLKNRNIKINYIDVSHIDEMEKEVYIENFKKIDMNKGFDLTNEMLIRISVIKTHDNKYKVICSFHHIILDGWCIGILLKDIITMYNAFDKGEKLEFEGKDDFSKYLEWLDNQDKEEALECWEKYLQGYEGESKVPSTDENQELKFENRLQRVKIQKELADKIRKIAHSNRITTSSVMQTAWGVLLQKYNNTDDVVFGSIVSGRPSDLKGVETMVGIFINTIPIRITGSGDKSFLQLSKELNKNFIEMNKYNYVSLADVQALTSVKNKLINHIVAYENYPLDANIFDGKEKSVRIIDNDTFEQTNYDFGLVITEYDDIELLIKYNGSVYKDETIKEVGENLYNILTCVAENSDVKLSEIDMLSKEEKNKVIYEFNDTKRDYVSGKTIQELFEAQVEKTPDNIVVGHENSELTYRELNEKANSLARVLRQKGISSESIVGIMLERSVDMLVGIMGILKSGGAYVPIDPEYPEDRIKYMLTDSNAKLLLTQTSLMEKVDFDGETINLGDKELYERHDSNLDKVCCEDNLAYVIYTSGTTGNPKGVMVEHKALVNLCNWHNDYYEVSEKDKATKYAGFAFDASVWEIFPYLIKGAAIEIIPKDIMLDVERLHEYYNEKGITISFLPTQVCEQFINFESKSLRVLLTGADKLKTYKETNYKLVNNYGPTENTVVSTSFVVDKQYKNIPIGKPIHNTSVYIQSKDGQTVPVGIPGELCVAGDNLARGYINKEDLTRERFVDNPFEPGRKMYKTGDIARWLPDGNIEYLGRIDDQVKIRGYRIEIGEIESQMLKIPAIKEAVVVARTDDNGNSYLCSYVTAEEEIAASTIKEELAKNLPRYMVPNYHIQVDTIPLTLNGKVDKKSLLNIEPKEREEIYCEAPSTEIEKKLMEIWKKQLGVESIGIDDDYFELGGHSLKAASIISNIRVELEVDIKIKDLFNNPNIKALSKLIESMEREQYVEIKRVGEKDYYIASSAERRLYALWELNKDSIEYNVPLMLELNMKLDKDRVEATLNKLIERHEIFRTRLEISQGEVIQRVMNEWKLDFKYEEIDINDAKYRIDNFIKPFDLASMPLLRGELLKLEEEKYIFMVDFHHITMDAGSMPIIINEFITLYKGEALDEVSYQYKDYSEWQNGLKEAGILRRQEEYWMNRFQGGIPTLNLRSDFERPKVRSVDGDRIRLALDRELAVKLINMAQRTGNTVYTLLLAAYNVLLFKYSDQEDIVVGTVEAGRRRKEFENIVGMFVNTLALRNYPEKDKDFRDFLEEVKENVVNDFDNGDYQFEDLIEKLEIKRDASRSPIFDVLFVFENSSLIDQNEKIRPVNLEFNISKFDLTLFVQQIEDEIEFSVEYSTCLFKKETMERFLEHYVNILMNITDDIDIKLKDINLISNDKRQALDNIKSRPVIDSVEFDF
ncbi:hypothetical protein CSC2_08550 [Clostridium zeae]|uniref:Carrier domain-containing protein n=1 Tax=Clostridium zeae TaxID=2759022 RepID=A0ABQ1E6F5_9CLOT|nr:non-ribosomal peptide synthetase [Clostridium zeae]GFZ30329.1 hypothetical protein CSC2_08550 [Clostridium zeae]